MDNLIISHLTLRKVIGILGMSLGFICILGGLIFGSGKVEESISAYYMTNMRDVIVAVLCATSAFLLTYKGYDILDNILSSIAAIAAIGVAFFPMAYVAPGNIFNFQEPAVFIFHFIFAAIFFLTLASISFFLFTKSTGDMTKEKYIRNIIYKTIGIIIFICTLLLFLNSFLHFGAYFVLIVEMIMLIVFGASWFIKGETIFKDKD